MSYTNSSLFHSHPFIHNLLVYNIIYGNGECERYFLKSYDRFASNISVSIQPAGKRRPVNEKAQRTMLLPIRHACPYLFYFTNALASSYTGKTIQAFSKKGFSQLNNAL